MMDARDFIEELIADFPRLFRGKAPMVASAPPPGWRALVRRLLTRIDVTLTDAEAQGFEILQIKEKYASLRFYWGLPEGKVVNADIRIGSTGQVQRFRTMPEPASSTFETIRRLVDEAEVDSTSICQDCGAGDASQTKFGGWHVTLCAKCEAAELAKREARS